MRKISLSKIFHSLLLSFSASFDSILMQFNSFRFHEIHHWPFGILVVRHNFYGWFHVPLKITLKKNGIFLLENRDMESEQQNTVSVYSLTVESNVKIWLLEAISTPAEVCSVLSANLRHSTKVILIILTLLSISERRACLWRPISALCSAKLSCVCIVKKTQFFCLFTQERAMIDFVTGEDGVEQLA